MREEVYQEIFEAVFPFLPDDWQRLIIREVRHTRKTMRCS